MSQSKPKYNNSGFMSLLAFACLVGALVVLDIFVAAYTGSSMVSLASSAKWFFFALMMHQVKTLADIKYNQQNARLEFQNALLNATTRVRDLRYEQAFLLRHAVPADQLKPGTHLGENLAVIEKQIKTNEDRITKLFVG